MAHNELLVDMGLEIVCPDCMGDGMVSSPNWAEYWKQNNPTTWNPESCPPPPNEPEEYLCDTCKGNGWIPTDRGRAILELVRRWLK